MIAEWAHQLWAEWNGLAGFQKLFTENLTAGLVTLLCIVGGFIIALVFEKKIGWILTLGGFAYLGHMLGLF